MFFALGELAWLYLLYHFYVFHIGAYFVLRAVFLAFNTIAAIIPPFQEVANLFYYEMNDIITDV